MPKKGSKNRKLKGIVVRELRLMIRHEQAVKLELLTGKLNQAEAVEIMIDNCYRRSVKRGLVPINSDSPS